MDTARSLMGIVAKLLEEKAKDLESHASPIAAARALAAKHPTR
jgi:hypothetical protein